MFSETEIRSRYEIKLEEYVKVLNIEAETALTMAQREILPAVMHYTGDMAKRAADIKALALPTRAEDSLLPKLCADTDALYERIEDAEDGDHLCGSRCGRADGGPLRARRGHPRDERGSRRCRRAGDPRRRARLALPHLRRSVV